MNQTLIVVPDAGPLIALAKLNVVHLLTAMYSDIHLARSVYEETLVKGLRRGFEDAHTLHRFLDQAGWSLDDVKEIQEPSNLVNAGLDRGERDTLRLALHLRPSLVLMGELLGRQVARTLGLPVKGTLGVLVEAYQRDHIRSEQLEFYFAEIVDRQDIWISPGLVQLLRRRIFE